MEPTSRRRNSQKSRTWFPDELPMRFLPFRIVGAKSIPILGESAGYDGSCLRLLPWVSRKCKEGIRIGVVDCNRLAWPFGQVGTVQRLGPGIPTHDCLTAAVKRDPAISASLGQQAAKNWSRRRDGSLLSTLINITVGFSYLHAHKQKSIASGVGTYSWQLVVSLLYFNSRER